MNSLVLALEQTSIEFDAVRWSSMRSNGVSVQCRIPGDRAGVIQDIAIAKVVRATCLTCGGTYYMAFIGNLTIFPAVTEMVRVVMYC